MMEDTTPGTTKDAGVAQLAEQRSRKPMVGGSIPLTGPILDMIEGQVDMPPEFSVLVDKYFWELV
jgi:hypothetical protein